MKLRLLALACLALTALTPVWAEQYSHREPFSSTHPFRDNGVLQLSNVNGSVEIQAWDRNEIRIEGEKSAKTAEELAAIDLSIEVREEKAVVRVKLPKRSGGWFGSNTIRANVSFKIMVPANAQLEQVDTVNAPVTIAGVRGQVKGETVNGNIKASGLRGATSLETVNGSIVAEFASIAAGQKLSFETVNGRVTVKLPADAGVKVETSVVNGSVSCDFPLTLGRQSRRALDGTIGDGRATLEAETVNGSIRIEKL